MERDPRDVVREGYNKIANQYDGESDPAHNENEFNDFMTLAKADGHILDAGCGTGAISQFLVDKGYQVTGVDISQVMLDIAAQRVPQAEFLLRDMTALEFNDGTFDGIISAYAVFHVPRTEHANLFKGFHRIVKKGGPLLISIGTMETDGVWVWEEFQNVPMFWSYYPPAKTIRLLESAGFEIVFTRDVEIVFAENVETHHWILARAL